MKANREVMGIGFYNERIFDLIGKGRIEKLLFVFKKVFSCAIYLADSLSYIEE